MEALKLNIGKVKEIKSSKTLLLKCVYFEDGTNHLMSYDKDFKVGDIIGIDPWGSLWVKQTEGA